MVKKIITYIIVSLLVLGLGIYLFFLQKKVAQIEQIAVSNYIKVQSIRTFLTLNFPAQLKAYDEGRAKMSQTLPTNIPKK